VRYSVTAALATDHPGGADPAIVEGAGFVLPAASQARGLPSSHAFSTSCFALGSPRRSPLGVACTPVVAPRREDAQRAELARSALRFHERERSPARDRPITTGSACRC
jgi:hypothetical protein